MSLLAGFATPQSGIEYLGYFSRSELALVLAATLAKCIGNGLNLTQSPQPDFQNLLSCNRQKPEFRLSVRRLRNSPQIEFLFANKCKTTASKHTSSVSQLKAGSVSRCQSDSIHTIKHTISSQLHNVIAKMYCR